jgi:hypothetical protein
MLFKYLVNLRKRISEKPVQYLSNVNCPLMGVEKAEVYPPTPQGGLYKYQ